MEGSANRPQDSTPTTGPIDLRVGCSNEDGCVKHRHLRHYKTETTTGRWEVKEWYEKNKDKMILHPATRSGVMGLLMGGKVMGMTMNGCPICWDSAKYCRCTPADKARHAERLRETQLTGIKILDPDGWRSPNEKSMDEPIDRDEWERRVAVSTISSTTVKTGGVMTEHSRIWKERIPSIGVTEKQTNPKDMIGSDKLPIHLWPTTATMMGCLAFLNGALKYGRANFRSVGVRASIYYDAARRHLDAWFEGEEIDPDDGVPHLSAALACIAIIVDAQAADKLTDDRHFPGGYRKLRDELEPLVKQLKAHHADRTPKHYTIGDKED